MNDQILTLQPSRRFLAAGAAVHLLACWAVSVAELTGWLQAALLAAVGIDFVAVFLARRRELVLRCQADGGLAVRQEGEWLAAAVLPDTLVWPWVVVLNFRPAEAGRRRTQVVLADSLTGAEFRRLRVWLRWRAACHSD